MKDRFIRIFNIDFEKYPSAMNLAVTNFYKDKLKYKTIFRKKKKSSLFECVKEIIKLNDKFKPSAIYIDKGFGEYQIEVLRKYGIENPESGLDKKIKGIHYANLRLV